MPVPIGGNVYAAERKYTYLIECPTCGWVGAFVVNPRASSHGDWTPTGNWRCCSMKCPDPLYTMKEWAERDRVPESQLRGFRETDPEC